MIQTNRALSVYTEEIYHDFKVLNLEQSTIVF